MPDKEFWEEIDTIEDYVIELYFRIKTEKRMVVEFAIQIAIRQQTEERGTRKIIRRYDCAHGYAHCDVYNQAGEQIEKVPLDGFDLNTAFTHAYKDLTLNAESYIRQYWNS